MQFEYFKHELTSPGYFTVKVPEPIMHKIGLAIDDIMKNGGEDVSDRLVGHISGQFNLFDNKELTQTLEKFLFDIAFQYELHYNYSKRYRTYGKDPILHLNSLWINFQNKTEFNPSHHHDGVYSFALWYKVPYNIKDEMELYKAKNDKAKPGCFEFTYIDALGLLQYETIPVDKSYDGVLCFFPAALHHAVHPFYTSDESRISLSGNLAIKEFK